MNSQNQSPKEMRWTLAYLLFLFTVFVTVAPFGMTLELFVLEWLTDKHPDPRLMIFIVGQGILICMLPEFKEYLNSHEGFRIAEQRSNSAFQEEE